MLIFNNNFGYSKLLNIFLSVMFLYNDYVPCAFLNLHGFTWRRIRNLQPGEIADLILCFCQTFFSDYYKV